MWGAASALPASIKTPDFSDSFINDEEPCFTSITYAVKHHDVEKQKRIKSGIGKKRSMLNNTSEFHLITIGSVN
jgi:hypothetical protein